MVMGWTSTRGRGKAAVFFMFVIVGLVFTWAALFASAPLVEQSFQVKFDHYTVNDGLSHGKVLDAYQDRFGYMWFATPDGLNRFDGYSFQVYRYFDKDSTSISNSYITCITEDAQGKLWIGTKKGLNQFNRRTEEFIRYHYQPDNENSIYHDHVRALLADTLGNLWIETVDGTLNQYVIKENRFEHYRHKKLSQPYYDYHEIYQDKNGYIWFGGRNFGPYRFNPSTGQMKYFSADAENPDKKRDNDIACIMEDSHGNFWMSATDGAYKFFPDSGRFEKFLWSSTFSIIEDSYTNLWFATGKGVYQYFPDKGNMAHYMHSANVPSSLVHDHVYKLHEDRAGNIWICTAGGISKYSPKKYKFSHYRHIVGQENCLPNNNVTATFQDSDGAIWIGTHGGGLSRFYPGKGRCENYQHQADNPNSITSNRVSCIYEDSRSRLWIGQWSGRGFDLFDKPTGRFTRYAILDGSFKKDWYNDFLEDRFGRFWAGVWGSSGMMEFDPEKGVFTGVHFISYHVPNDRPVKDMAILPDGRVFLGVDRFVIFSLQTAGEDTLGYASGQKPMISLPFWTGTSFNGITHTPFGS